MAYAGPPTTEPRRADAEVRVVEVDAVINDPGAGRTEQTTDTATGDATQTPPDTTRWRLREPGQPERPPTERAWRTAADPQDRTALERSRRWRPAEPPRPVSVFDAATEQDFIARRQALTALIAPPGADATTLLGALRAFLASPVLEQVERHDDAERWIAGLITHNTPRSDALIDLAVAHFHWDEGRVGPRSLVGARVLARREDLRFLRAADGVGGPYQGAYAALICPPSRWRTLVNRLTPDLGRKVSAFLVVIRGQRPGLAEALNSDAVAWWDAYLSQPRLGPIALWALIVAALLPLAGAADALAKETAFDPLGASIPLIGVVAGVLIRLYAVAWPRRLWRRRWAASAPGWVGVAWAPAALTVLAAATVVPASALATACFAALALAPMVWAITVGDPDTRQFGQPIPPFRWRGPILSLPFAFGFYVLGWGLLRPGVRFAWPLRALFEFTYLAIFWLVASSWLPDRTADQMTLPLVAAAVAYVVGAGTLGAAWQALGGRRRHQLLIALAGLVAAALAALWLVRWVPSSAPLAAALVCLAVLLHKTPAMRLEGFSLALRDVVMRFGGLVVLWLVANAASVAPVFELLAAATVVALIVVAERMTERKAAPRHRAKQAAALLLRFGWIAGGPFLILGGLGQGWTPLLAVSLWMLTGVGVTLSALAPPAPRPTS